MDIHDVISTSDLISFILRVRKKTVSYCLHCIRPLCHFSPQDKEKEHLFVTGDLLHHSFYLWEVKIDFLPLVTLKSQPCPFCYTLKEFSGMGIKGLGSCSFKGSKQHEKTLWAVLSILCKQSISASEEALAKWVNNM